MDELQPVSLEHRERRRAAHGRAADAYEHAADVHDDAAKFFDEHDKPETADDERAHAEVGRRAAEPEHDQVDRDTSE